MFFFSTSYSLPISRERVCSWFTVFFRSPAKCYLTSLTPTACWFFLKLQHKHGSRRKPVTLKNLKWAVTGFAFCFPNKCQFVYYASSFLVEKKKPLKACNECSRDQARDFPGMRCHRQHGLSSPLICEAGGRIVMMPHLVGGCRALRDSWESWSRITKPPLVPVVWLGAAEPPAHARWSCPPARLEDSAVSPSSLSLSLSLCFHPSVLCSRCPLSLASSPPPLSSLACFFLFSSVLLQQISPASDVKVLHSKSRENSRLTAWILLSSTCVSSS